MGSACAAVVPRSRPRWADGLLCDPDDKQSMFKKLDGLARLPSGMGAMPLTRRSGPYLVVFRGRSKYHRRPVLEERLPIGAKPKDRSKAHFSDAYLPTAVWTALRVRAAMEAAILADIGEHKKAAHWRGEIERADKERLAEQFERTCQHRERQRSQDQMTGFLYSKAVFSEPSGASGSGEATGSAIAIVQVLSSESEDETSGSIAQSSRDLATPATAMAPSCVSIHCSISDGASLGYFAASVPKSD